MKRFLLVIAFLLVCANSQAASWVKLAEDDRELSYIDVEYIEVINNEVRAVWTRTVSKANNNDFSLAKFGISKNKYLCVIESNVYSKEKNVANHKHKCDWESIVPGTIGETMYEIAFGTKSGKPE